jgi:hypothetical protein
MGVGTVEFLSKQSIVCDVEAYSSPTNRSGQRNNLSSLPVAIASCVLLCSTV